MNNTKHSHEDQLIKTKYIQKNHKEFLVNTFSGVDGIRLDAHTNSFEGLPSKDHMKYQATLIALTSALCMLPATTIAQDLRVEKQTLEVRDLSNLGDVLEDARA